MPGDGRYAGIVSNQDTHGGGVILGKNADSFVPTSRCKVVTMGSPLNAENGTIVGLVDTKARPRLHAPKADLGIGRAGQQQLGVSLGRDAVIAAVLLVNVPVEISDRIRERNAINGARVSNQLAVVDLEALLRLEGRLQRLAVEGVHANVRVNSTDSDELVILGEIHA